MTDSPEALLFKKLETLLESRGLEFTAPMRLLYWQDPAFKAIFCLIMELFERIDWNPWEEFEQ